MATYPGSVPSNVVTQNDTTGALEVGGVAVTGATEYTLTQFLQLDVADYPNYTILISDIPTPHSTVNGVLVRANSAGTAWIWTETMSLTVAQIASYAITAAIASGWRIFVSDIGVRGSYWYSNGTRFNLDQDSVVLASLAADAVLTGTSSYKVAAQYAIPTLDSKSIWGDGDLIEVHQVLEKTGGADGMLSAVYLNTAVKVLDDAEAGTSIVAASTSNNAQIAMGLEHRIRRISSTSVRLQSGAAQTTLATVSQAKAAVVTGLSNLDTTATYIDAAARFTTGGSDTALTLTARTIRLISAGAV